MVTSIPSARIMTSYYTSCL